MWQITRIYIWEMGMDLLTSLTMWILINSIIKFGINYITPPLRTCLLFEWRRREKCFLHTKAELLEPLYLVQLCWQIINLLPSQVHPLMVCRADASSRIRRYIHIILLRLCRSTNGNTSINMSLCRMWHRNRVTKNIRWVVGRPISS